MTRTAGISRLNQLLSSILLVVTVLFLSCIPSKYVFIEDAIIPIEDVPAAPAEPVIYNRPEFKALSIRELQKQYRRCLKMDAGCPDSVHNLGGLTSVEGYVLDTKKHDVILLGQSDSTRPPLLTDDLIVLLRCAGKQYVEGNMFTPPGCSIDPLAEAWKELEKVGNAMNMRKDFAAFEEEWNNACRQMQSVRVLGMPFNTHTASVFVKADYDMKMIIDGQDQLDIPGFYDMYTLSKNRYLESFRNKKVNTSTDMTMNRFWFYPEKYHFIESPSMTILDTCRISLLTEAQYLSKNNIQSKTGVTNPIAQQVAQRFTRHFESIAEKRSVFKQFKELYRLYCILEALIETSAFSQANLDVSFFMNKYDLKEYPVSEQLPGKPRYPHETFMGGDGFSMTKIDFVHPMCGGVMLHVALSDESFFKSDSPTLKSLSKTVLISRGSPDELRWNVKNGSL